MRRIRFALFTLVFVLALPAAAGAQLPYVPGPLVDPALVTPPESVPAGPVGEYPEDWAKCVAQTRPTWPTAPAGIDPRAVDPSAPNPLLGQRFFVDRLEPAYMQWVKWRRGGEATKANTIWKLAREPRFRWFGKFTSPRMQKKIRGYLDRVQCDQPGTVPLMVVMRHQGKGCSGTYRAGGVAEDRRTMKWYDDFAESVGNARVVIGFEPDSLGTVDCLASDRRKARLDVLRYGVNVLSQLPNATIYLEAGASDWEPAARTAKQLRYIGINKVRGFMLNVTHHDWTRANIQHGLQISRLVGGKHFIINTSYNGRGPLHYRKWINRGQHKWRTINVWCHPGLRGLGPAPTTQTANPLVDAYMYINRPGYSAGSCNGGPLPVGTWWAQRALMYAEYATDWLSAPPGTKYGLFGHHTLKQLGAFG
ncbi:MAG TPA: glycoside hydrolase family 6 protein [Thermoleophilaceae bacterium]